LSGGRTKPDKALDHARAIGSVEGMPEFKADLPKREPLRCCIHGNDLSCPGAGRCPGFLHASSAPRDDSHPSDGSIQKAVDELSTHAAPKFASDEDKNAAVLKRARELDAASSISLIDALKASPSPLEAAREARDALAAKWHAMETQLHELVRQVAAHIPLLEAAHEAVRQFAAAEAASKPSRPLSPQEVRVAELEAQLAAARGELVK
jgi:hypothetical protein